MAKFALLVFALAAGLGGCGGGYDGDPRIVEMAQPVEEVKE